MIYGRRLEVKGTSLSSWDFAGSNPVGRTKLHDVERWRPASCCPWRRAEPGAYSPLVEW